MDQRLRPVSPVIYVLRWKTLELLAQPQSNAMYETGCLEQSSVSVPPPTDRVFVCGLSGLARLRLFVLVALDPDCAQGARHGSYGGN